MARSPPDTPAKKELTMKLSSLCQNRFIPMASAVISSSRMALKARPYEEFISKTMNAMQRPEAIKTKVVGGKGISVNGTFKVVRSR